MAVDYSTDTEEYEVVGGNSPDGEFPPMWDFDTTREFKAVYQGSRPVNTRNGERLVHRFLAHEGTDLSGLEGDLLEDNTFDCWGAAILNSRLEQVPAGTRVKVISTGKKIPTKSGRAAKEFEVLAAKGAIAR